MKKFIFVFIVGFLTLNSCDNFLTEAPKDEISTNQLLDSPETVTGLVNGLYREGRAAGFYDSGFGGANVMFGGFMSGFFDNEAEQGVLERGEGPDALRGDREKRVWHQCDRVRQPILHGRVFREREKSSLG